MHGQQNIKKKKRKDIQSFKGADCDSDQYLVVAKVRERLAVTKKQHRSLMGKNLI